MIDIELVFRNYRCFGDEPTRLRISDGFTALVGVNNSGKSSLLRLLYEIRPLLNILARNQSGWTQGLMKGADIGAVWSPQLLGGERAFRADSENDIEMTFIVRDGPDGSVAISGEQLLLALHLLRDGRTTSELRDQSGTVLGQPGTPFNIGAQDFQPLLNAMSAAMGELADTMYVGPFRNAINIGAQQSYYDIQTGDAFVRAFAAYKSGPDPSQNEAVFQLIEELRRIFDFRSLDINAAPDSQTLQLTA